MSIEGASRKTTSLPNRSLVLRHRKSFQMSKNDQRPHDRTDDSPRAAVAGMLYAGRLQSGRFQLGEGDELSVIAAAVLGGTSLFGGAGTVVGSIMGALMIGLINNGLILMGLEFSQQLIARGAIIIIAVAISQSRKR